MHHSVPKRFSFSLLLALAVTLQTGCGTVIGLATDDASPVYAGVVADMRGLELAANDANGHRFGRLFAIPAILDAPLSFAVDTALLPFTVLAHCLKQ